MVPMIVTSSPTTPPKFEAQTKLDDATTTNIPSLDIA